MIIPETRDIIQNVFVKSKNNVRKVLLKDIGTMISVAMV
jgi:hypothetical protein